ncbi:MAG: leucine-rich repeat domain-containing protein [Clostridia bacterium]|nr:leucine-rich repeat domain-containing protein [Clostridia bacterium]
MKKTIISIITIILAAVLASGCAGTPQADQTIPNPAAIDVPADEESFDPASLADPENTLEYYLGAFDETVVLSTENAVFTETEDGLRLESYEGSLPSVTVPEKLEGKTVASVGENAFAGHTELTSLSLPDSLRAIPAGILADCAALCVLCLPINEEQVCLAALFDQGQAVYTDNPFRVPDSLKCVCASGSIPECFFWGCTGLVCACVEGSEIGDYVFYGCGLLQSIILRSGLTAIGSSAFYNTAIETLTVPGTVESIGLGAFGSCNALRSLELPFVGGSREDNTYLGYVFGAENYTWSGDFISASLWRVTLEEGCESLGEWAFYGSRIREVSLPQSLVSIGIRAFSDCEYLRSAELPDAVRSIGRDAFFRCLRLRTVHFPEQLERIGEQAFYRCASLESAALPDGLGKIPDLCFYGCQSLAEVSFNPVCLIGVKAFAGTPVQYRFEPLPETE